MAQSSQTLWERYLVPERRDLLRDLMSEDEYRHTSANLKSALANLLINDGDKWYEPWDRGVREFKLDSGRTSSALFITYWRDNNDDEFFQLILRWDTESPNCCSVHMDIDPYEVS